MCAGEQLYFTGFLTRGSPEGGTGGGHLVQVLLLTVPTEGGQIQGTGNMKHGWTSSEEMMSLHLLDSYNHTTRTVRNTVSSGKQLMATTFKLEKNT